jgi:2-keto-4-pentenoate hydratase
MAVTFVGVNATTLTTLLFNSQSGTTYTFVLTDADNTQVETTSSSAVTLTVPPNADVAFPTGSQINIAQIGSGQITVQGGSGVTVNATPGLKFRAQYSTAVLIKRSTNSWLLVGDLSA